MQLDCNISTFLIFNPNCPSLLTYITHIMNNYKFTIHSTLIRPSFILIINQSNLLKNIAIILKIKTNGHQEQKLTFKSFIHHHQIIDQIFA
jgi:uncharacterized membrane protein